MTGAVDLSTVAETLTATQRWHLEAVEQAHREEPERLRRVLLLKRQAVADAITAGVPARLIADRLGVTRARVYQLRQDATHAGA